MGDFVKKNPVCTVIALYIICWTIIQVVRSVTEIWK